jgi:hypothetical protein
VDSYLTTAEVLEIVAPLGVTPKQFRGWCEKGYVAPDEGGGSQGDHRKFGLMTTVGVAVAARVLATERGCLPAYVGTVVSAFRKRTADWLREEFAAGRTHVAAIVTKVDGGPTLILDAPRPYEAIDVQAAYAEVTRAVRWIERRLRDAAAARLRGLGGEKPKAGD